MRKEEKKEIVKFKSTTYHTVSMHVFLSYIIDNILKASS